MNETVAPFPIPVGPKNLTLSEMIRGQVESRFQAALAELAENLADKRTGLGYRKIKIEFSLKPNEDRTAVDVAVSVQTKRQPIEIAEDVVRLIVPTHGAARLEPIASQTSLFPADEEDEEDEEDPADEG